MDAFTIAAIVAATVGLFALLNFGTQGRRDKTAFEFCDARMPVSEVVGPAETDAEIRALNAIVVAREDGSLVVLGPNQLAVAEELLTAEGDTATLGCITRTYRVCKVGGQWGVVLLPRYLGFLGRQCEHGADYHDDEGSPS